LQDRHSSERVKRFRSPFPLLGRGFDRDVLDDCKEEEQKIQRGKTGKLWIERRPQNGSKLGGEKQPPDSCQRKKGPNGGGGKTKGRQGRISDPGSNFLCNVQRKSPGRLWKCVPKKGRFKDLVVKREERRENAGHETGQS